MRGKNRKLTPLLARFGGLAVIVALLYALCLASMCSCSCSCKGSGLYCIFFVVNASWRFLAAYMYALMYSGAMRLCKFYMHRLECHF